MTLQLRSPLLAQTTLSSCVLFFLLISSPGPVTAAGELTVVWGRNRAEGSLREACDTGLYATVILSFLRVAGHGKYLTDLSGHDVSTVGADVKHCQSAKNVTVLLSVAGSYNSPATARDVADHLWNAFLGGGSRRGGVRRPFGDAVLDGVNFYLDGEAEQERFSDLVRRRLQESRNNGGRNGAANKAVRLTATPPCSRVLDADMSGGELGLFERLHVRFYNEARCGYDYHEMRPFWGAWHMWVLRFPAARLLVGLPATDGMRGWIDPATLRDSVLPSVHDDPNYGGLMLWDRYYDKLTGYSRAIDP
ncbi:hypothetical protein SETIT_8G136200v2 [Setaria italica]|uniref:GH18 domain-containing protein n=1 Tax=Setaria italica TaxID=4555 RepID=K3ZJC6_SETIT|nr:xylanase inhibitor protein 1 [Setaria italica]RCV38364.1 hypothetical protein SETIT_8G136200v2 [Setaria italica]